MRYAQTQLSSGFYCKTRIITNNTVHNGSNIQWTVFFMRKLWKRVLLCALISGLFWGASLLTDRKALNDNLIRLHVVANSDSEQDQTVKLRVRDAVLESIQEDLKQVANIDQARDYLQENLPKIQSVTEQTLHSLGVDTSAVVSLTKEAFDTRKYDTFSLPAGIYEALRITIGEGEGKNWWCVTFPTLCLPATVDGFRDAAVGAGFSQSLTDTLSADDCEIRFFLLDAIGRLETQLFDS